MPPKLGHSSRFVAPQRLQMHARLAAEGGIRASAARDNRASRHQHSPALLAPPAMRQSFGPPHTGQILASADAGRDVTTECS